MILKINEGIAEETVDKLVSFYNELNIEKNEKAVTYFSSRGGDRQCMEIMRDMINYFKEKTFLIGYRNLLSCGFELFYTVECNKSLVGDCVGMFHQSSTNVSLNELLKPEYSEDKAKLTFMEKTMGPITTKLSFDLQFTDKEHRKLRKGDDVWFQPNRMREFLEIVQP